MLVLVLEVVVAGFLGVATRGAAPADIEAGVVVPELCCELLGAEEAAAVAFFAIVVVGIVQVN